MRKLQLKRLEFFIFVCEIQPMNTILDRQPEPEQRPRQFAGFWIRVAAYLIDSVIFGITAGILLVASGAFFAIFDVTEPDASAVAVGILLFYALIIGAYLLYFASMESSKQQATLGKMAVGIKVGDRYGKRISFANALGRTASKWVSGIVFYIGFIMIAWDDHKQGLHDKIADTYVFEN
ncbi:MAG: RDD family protein [Cyclobacteriaceae bacterium]|nr:MAG: RDD family protein [Cyclobacteriaceae bacterium]